MRTDGHLSSVCYLYKRARRALDLVPETNTYILTSSISADDSLTMSVSYWGKTGSGLTMIEHTVEPWQFVAGMGGFAAGSYITNITTPITNQDPEGNRYSLSLT